MNDAFDRVLQAYEGKKVHGSEALFAAIGKMFETGQFDAAYALSRHANDMHQDEDPFDLHGTTWTDFYLEAFRRTYFDRAEACKYGTDFLARNPQMVNTVALELIAEAEAYGRDDPPMTLEGLPSNVTLFPAAKARQ